MLIHKRIVLSIEVEEKVSGDQDALFSENKDLMAARVDQLVGGYGFNVIPGTASAHIASRVP